MRKTLLAALGVAGMLSFTTQAQTTPTGTARMGKRPASKATPGNSGSMAPNRSSTAGTPDAATSNNPVDATGKPVGTTPSGTTSTVKAHKPKN
ncbi:hypothetical protein HHL22_08025 [Hymenobacter sp. RP-2-7]|uniref:Proteophosphoglycan ppg4 n=1 Tax=Hymenobacter polaris TaxID=2682546 RepID=A0A7Y0ADL6_9BACT|nr:hypothetical protein [Hymenobacter polaris]NML65150.1 hypothetical protein [Hymenobacter polaris]